MGAAVAGVAADLAWSASIAGDWDAQSRGSVVGYCVLIGVYTAAAVAAVIVAARSRARAREWIVASVGLAVVVVAIALIGLFGVALSRGPFI
jgi:hypothetical protein